MDSNIKNKTKNIKKFKLKVLLKTIFLFILIIAETSIYYFTIFKIRKSKKISINHFTNNTNRINETKILTEIKDLEKSIINNLSTNIFSQFRYINTQNKLIDENIKFKLEEKPDITVIMTIYNQAHCLHKCLRSIQNQSLKNIEIIIIDDCSLDNSAELIKEYQKEDPRIILLEHDTNEGRMKTRVDGIRQSKGNYITMIDGDDAFIHKDILNNSLYIARKANLDYVEFQAGVYKNGRFIYRLKNYPDLKLDYIVHQPELRTKFYTNQKNSPGDFNNRAIWGKLIHKELLLQALSYIGEEFTEDYINESEDTIVVVSLFHLANSYYLMKELGYYYSLDEKRNDFPSLKNKFCKANDDKIKDFGNFKFLKCFVDKIFNNTKEQNLAFVEVTTSVNYDDAFNKIKMGKKHYDILFYIFNKTLDFNYLDKEKKYKIMELKNRAIEKINKEILNNITITKEFI